MKRIMQSKTLSPIVGVFFVMIMAIAMIFFVGCAKPSASQTRFVTKEDFSGARLAVLTDSVNDVFVDKVASNVKYSRYNDMASMVAALFL